MTIKTKLFNFFNIRPNKYLATKKKVDKEMKELGVRLEDITFDNLWTPTGPIGSNIYRGGKFIGKSDISPVMIMSKMGKDPSLTIEDFIND